MAGLGLQGAFGLAGAQQSLEQLLAQRMAAEKAAQALQQQQIENSQRDRQIGQGDQRLALDQGEFGFKQRAYADEAPTREAGRLYTVAQTNELARKPLAEQEGRLFTTQRDAAEHGYRLGEIGASGAEARRTKAAPDAKLATADGGPSPYAQERNTRNLQSIDEISKKVNNWTTGVGSVLANIPATDARNFAAELNTLKANIAFGELTAMREASKTGGALGQVSERELALLTSALGALDPGQSPENIRQQLQKIKGSIERWSAAAGGAPAPMASHAPRAGVRIKSITQVP